MAARARVLLVDDDEDLNIANKLALEAAGFDVETALSGEEGFRKATTARFAVAVVDVMMEARDTGFDLARKLRQDQRTRAMPLLMLTGINADVKKHQSLLNLSDRDIDGAFLPVDKFVDKPVTGARLVELVGRLARLPGGPSKGAR